MNPLVKLHLVMNLYVAVPEHVTERKNSTLPSEIRAHNLVIMSHVLQQCATTTVHDSTTLVFFHASK